MTGHQFALVMSAVALSTVAGRLSAAVTDLKIGAGESVIFSDDLGASSSKTDTVNPTNPAVGLWYSSSSGVDTGTFTTYGSNNDSVWAPDTAGAQSGIKVKISTSALNVANGAINIYYRVATQSVLSSTLNNRTEVGLYNTQGGVPGSFGFRFTNGGTSSYYYYQQDQSGLTKYDTALSGGQSTSQTVQAGTFANFRLTLSKNSDGSYAISEAIDMTGSGVYVSYWDPLTITDASSTKLLGSSSGNFQYLYLYQRNNSTDTSAYDYFDAIVVTQSPVPEPASVAILGGAAAAGLLLTRRR